MAFNFGKNLFPTTQPSVLATYDAFDIAQGVGYITLYGGNVSTVSGGSVYRLSPILFNSHNIDTNGSLKASAGEYDFQTSSAFRLQFQRPIDIGGKTIVNIPIAPTAGAGTNYPTGIAVISLWKEEEGVTGQTLLYPRTSGGVVTGALGSSGFLDKFSAIPINIPLTHLKATDTLRLDVETWSASNGGDTADCYLGHDPLNKTASGGNYELKWGNVGSRLTFQVPVKIDI